MPTEGHSVKVDTGVLDQWGRFGMPCKAWSDFQVRFPFYSGCRLRSPPENRLANMRGRGGAFWIALLPGWQSGKIAILLLFFNCALVAAEPQGAGRQLTIMPHMIENDNWKQYTTGFTEISFWKFSSFSLKTCLTPWCSKQSHFFRIKKSVFYKTFSLLG